MAGDEIVLSTMEHHSNLVPWQMTAAKTGAVLKFARLTEVYMYSSSSVPYIHTYIHTVLAVMYIYMNASIHTHNTSPCAMVLILA